MEKAKEIVERNDALCGRIRELTVWLAEANSQVERQEELVRQKEKDPQLKSKEAARMARLIQELKDATKKRESSKKDVEVRSEHLQNEVEDLRKEKCGHQCEVEAAKLKRKEIVAG
ncbi:uncharacterized protein LOC135221211 [Macrobrachium nipponense]|uniref:uncharacterized protein LOC135221211 n=1 Tax=Macrobrachium nipponense TaxID=159736 RepID=UPI0030C853C2